MRISDDRYSRDRLRLDLALRFIRHEARTHTIRTWTGLTDDRIRKLVRSYFGDENSRVTRHRGKSPRQIAYFLRTPRIQHETTVLASLLCLFDVLPRETVPDPLRALPSVRRGELLCQAFEAYRTLIPDSQITFEHAVFLITALACGEELTATLCGDCRGLMVVDRYAAPQRRCAACERTLQGELLPLPSEDGP